MKSSSKHSDKKVFWREQMGSFAKFKGSKRAFCKLHGLSMSTFQYWHRQLNQAKIREVEVIEPSPFIKVEVGPQALPANRTRPDAKWVAELILHLQEGLR